jgi:hypothetical protein
MAGQVKGAAKVATRLEELLTGVDGGVKGSKAEEYVREYYEPGKYHGSTFDDTDSSPDKFTEHDLLKLSLLSVPVNGSIARDFLDGFFDEPLKKQKGKSLNEMLAEVPNGVTFEGSLDEKFERTLDKGSPADTLWKAVRKVSKERGWKMGQTRTSKLLAAKRPELIPIYDSVVAEAFGRANSKQHWTDLRELFTQNEDLAKNLFEISKESGRQLSVIRVLDVVLWMDGRKGHSKVG